MEGLKKVHTMTELNRTINVKQFAYNIRRSFNVKNRICVSKNQLVGKCDFYLRTGEMLIFHVLTNVKNSV
jgi:hypothetical protein